MKYTLNSYNKLVGDLKQANNTIKQLREANEFKRDEIDRLISKIKLPWFLAASLFSLLIWSLLLCWSLLL